MDKSDQNHGSRCKCPHHKLNGILIALIGLAFLLAHLDVIPMHVVGMIWPVLLILIGLKKSFGRGMCKCCQKP